MPWILPACQVLNLANCYLAGALLWFLPRTKFCFPPASIPPRWGGVAAHLLLFFPVNWGFSWWADFFPGGPFYVENVHKNIHLQPNYKTTFYHEMCSGSLKSCRDVSGKLTGEHANRAPGKTLKFQTGGNEFVKMTIAKQMFHENGIEGTTTAIKIYSYCCVVGQRLVPMAHKKIKKIFWRCRMCFALVRVQQAVHQSSSFREELEIGILGP